MRRPLCSVIGKFSCGVDEMESDRVAALAVENDTTTNTSEEIARTLVLPSQGNGRAVCLYHIPH